MSDVTATYPADVSAGQGESYIGMRGIVVMGIPCKVRSGFQFLYTRTDSHGNLIEGLSHIIGYQYQLRWVLFEGAYDFTIGQTHHFKLANPDGHESTISCTLLNDTEESPLQWQIEFIQHQSFIDAGFLNVTQLGYQRALSSARMALFVARFTEQLFG